MADFTTAKQRIDKNASPVCIGKRAAIAKASSNNKVLKRDVLVNKTKAKNNKTRIKDIIYVIAG